MEQCTFKIIQNYYDTGNLFTKKEITLNKGLTIFVGCNGCGKTTMMEQLKHQCDKRDIEVIDFNNYTNGGTSSMSALMWRGQMEDVATMAMSSEGERIYQNIGLQSNLIGRKLRDMQSIDGDKTLFVFMDAIDSGFSIDNTIEVKDFINEVLLVDAEKFGIDIFLIISANAYEFANGSNCFDVRHCKYITFKDYDEYKKFIIKTREEKEARLERYRKRLERIEANRDPWGDPHAKERRRKKKDESSDN